MQRAISAALLAGVVLAGCETDEPPSDHETCVDLCEDFRWLGCKFESDQFWNPVQTVVGASLNGECSDRCRVYAATYGTVGSACEARMVELMRCTAAHGLGCFDDDGYSLPVVAGCDDAARRVGIRSTDPVLPRRRVSRQSGAHDGNGIEVG